MKLKLGLPQVLQIQEMLEQARASYSLSSMLKHFLWYQVLQPPSHKMPGWLHLTGLAQIPQGNLKVGPGLDSTEPERRSRRNIKRACLLEESVETCFERLKQRFCESEAASAERIEIGG